MTSLSSHQRYIPVLIDRRPVLHNPRERINKALISLDKPIDSSIPAFIRIIGVENLLSPPVEDDEMIDRDLAKDQWFDLIIFAIFILSEGIWYINTSKTLFATDHNSIRTKTTIHIGNHQSIHASILNGRCLLA